MNNETILDALAGIIDPELGINIVDLGLVYRAEFTPGGIVVRFTMTSPACPVSEMMLTDVEAALRQSFPDSPAVDVALIWDPPWSPERLTDAARAQLGWGAPAKPAAPPSPPSPPSWAKRMFRNLTRH